VNQVARYFRESTQRKPTVAARPKPRMSVCSRLGLVTGLTALAMPLTSAAESRTGNGGASASINFRIVIPAIIRVKAITQPDHIAIEQRHITQGYIDLEGGSTVQLTTNNRAGYLLSANYDSTLLSSVEIRISNQSLTASSGFGSMRVVAGLIIDKLVPISYRLNLAPGVQAGAYRWPVALAFSLANA